MKYKVGDIVKLRDDLEDGKKYGTVRYAREMDFIKGKPMELIAKSNALKNCYITKDEEYVEWYLTDEMIEGLWEECKGITYEPYEGKTNKYKLIDILNKIANGELKEGTKVIFEDIELIYKNGDLEHEDGYSICCIMHNSKDLLSEVELIEPQEPTECEHEWKNYAMYNPNTGGSRDFRKCAKCDLEEDIEPTDNTKLEELELEDKYYTVQEIIGKLNEVIRYINKEDKYE